MQHSYEQHNEGVRGSTRSEIRIEVPAENAKPPSAERSGRGSWKEQSAQILHPFPMLQNFQKQTSSISSPHYLQTPCAPPLH